MTVNYGLWPISILILTNVRRSTCALDHSFLSMVKPGRDYSQWISPYLCRLLFWMYLLHKSSSVDTKCNELPYIIMAGIKKASKGNGVSSIDCNTLAHTRLLKKCRSIESEGSQLRQQLAVYMHTSIHSKAAQIRMNYIISDSSRLFWLCMSACAHGTLMNIMMICDNFIQYTVHE